MSRFLQVAGAALEIGGLLLVASGISERRQLLWPHKRHFLVRLWHRSMALAGEGGRLFLALQGKGFRWLQKNLLRQKIGPKTHNVGLTASAESTGSLSMKVISRGWEGLSEEETLDLVRQRIDEHRGRLDDLAERVDEQAEAIDQELPNLKDELSTLIKEASAGNLGKDAWGVLLFMLGVVLNTWGNLIV